MSQLVLGILIAAMVFVSSASALAQDNAASAGSNQSGGAQSSGGQKGGNAKGTGPGGKRTTINFEDQLIEGQAQKPELFYLLQQRNNNFKRLIRLRENFLPEMRKSSEDIGRNGAKANGN